jgi:hypothetical protein
MARAAEAITKGEFIARRLGRASPGLDVGLEIHAEGKIKKT